MPLINVPTKEIHCKIVYYGPGFCGKTTNLKYIHSRAPVNAKGELLTLATETERTLFFDFLPLDLGTVHGYKVRFHLYTVPGQPLYERTRVMLLNGVDGVVFVADSGRNRFKDNVQSFYEMQKILAGLGKPLADLPLVIQYNKRDLADAVPAPILNARLNSYKSPHFLAIATKGTGVFDTLRAVSKLVVAKL
ncbi:MAG: GTPase domain-containing protein [Dehalococcoidales bacterium]|nr:GTPase domain-containing protein [Dehalococcoidales bacterium]